jgi:hypothetical protein
MPDLNWELWRLRLSDEVARQLRREVALAAARESQPSGAHSDAADPDRTPRWVWLLFTHAAAFGFGVIAEAMR